MEEERIKNETNLVENCVIWFDSIFQFLAVHNSSIGDLVTDSLTQSVTFTFGITE